MLLALVALVAGLGAGWVARRRLPYGLPNQGPRRRRWRAPGLVAAGVVISIVGGDWLPGSIGRAVMAAGYLLLAGFAALNWRHPGLALAGAGLLANLAVVLVNGGMPVRGLPAGVGYAGHHHGLSSRDRLPGLADTIRVAPLGETVSPGDLLIGVGGAIAAFAWLEPATTPGRPGRTRRPRRVGTP